VTAVWVAQSHTTGSAGIQRFQTEIQRRLGIKNDPYSGWD
jgi:hypothetical protein